MTSKKIAFGTAALLILLVCVGCQRSQGGLSVVGSTSVQPFAEILAEEYMGHHSGEKVYIQGGGSSAGIQAVMSEAAQVGMSSRSLMPDERTLFAVPIAYDAIAVIVHRTNPIKNLRLDQIREIFSGRIRNWQDVGGRNHRITLVSREEGSGTREAFQHLVMKKSEVSLGALVQDSNGAIRQVVADDPQAIGYISLGLVDKRVRAVSIDGVEASVENIRGRHYRIVRPFLFVFRAEPQAFARKFLEFVLSPSGQKLLVDEGLVSWKVLSDDPQAGGR